MNDEWNESVLVDYRNWIESHGGRQISARARAEQYIAWCKDYCERKGIPYEEESVESVMSRYTWKRDYVLNCYLSKHETLGKRLVKLFKGKK